MDFAFINHLSPQLATFFLAMIPVTELRASIPIALSNFDLSLQQVFIWSVLGNFIPIIVVLFFIGPTSQWLSRKWKLADRFLQWWFAKVKKRFHGKYNAWGKIALLIFVAIPLPGTGAWTGSIAAWLLNIDKKDAFAYIALGVILAGVLVSSLTLGLLSFFNGHEII
ncbi:MAG: ligand-binding protein SH3 [Candidatus Komeilibacteria bacterium CG11_big_fil_rev_8_21_14_0_20_36_20]|uniref:Ligand-binding protein SH3 n=1 Tax=Candidatus Komeilibacteria bacterium CG11_big_fil_rev_8_21_14_0_20_36_20 TaxID=1974477 RepID=A0A2H0NB15_9BACT|nr:MAG: ligand-binding protein SH3 [Candidatus Komeilibacteria bacterium CG11_big_fil_rev_8_21_14_0_20_36_20]PIR82084.1 MAG: ligand-binding protein SH3 [Candidatus Komeilibacteria bacterium CG10_big_fil_rev_8_21_14_0_10_36_65]PJC55695.1 MAG: ligand-binding protein SH3 [Candidatus Komeilibacteria bacterium CG_4_9_14_0_2_um_filter_36_13]